MEHEWKNHPRHHQHQRGRRFCRRRHPGQNLPPGHHRRRNRLHGRLRSRKVFGGSGVKIGKIDIT